MTDDLQLVREDATGDFGLHRPAENVIETYLGDERHDVPDYLLGQNWHPVEEAELRESIETDIAAVREEIADLRERDLSDEQAATLREAESRLASYERVLEIAREVDAADA